MMQHTLEESQGKGVRWTQIAWEEATLMTARIPTGLGARLIRNTVTSSTICSTTRAGDTKNPVAVAIPGCFPPTRRMRPSGCRRPVIQEGTRLVTGWQRFAARAVTGHRRGSELP